MAGKWEHIAELSAYVLGHESRLRRLEKKEKRMSEQFDAIKATVQSLVTEDGFLLQQFADLKAKVDAGEVVSKEDLDELQAALTGEVERVHTAVAVADPEDPTGGTDESVPTDGGVVVNDPGETPGSDTPVFGSGGVGPSA